MAGKIAMMVMSIMMLALVGRLMAADECNGSIQQIAPCYEYLMSGTPVPLRGSSCCSGVTHIYSQATTSTSLIQNLCNCLKNEANQYNLNDEALQNLAPACGIQLAFSITKNIDCSKIHV